MRHLLLTTIAVVVLVGTAFADPIHDAAKSGDIAGVQAELDKGVDVNAKREGGSTPLHGAAAGGHEEIVELLIANGANVNVKDGFGRTPLDAAELVYEWDSPDIKVAKRQIADLLRKHGGKTGEELALMPQLSFLRSPFGFTFNTIEGKKYSVESGIDLKKSNKLREINGTGNEAKFIDVRRIYFPQHFYRVVVVD